MNADVVNYAKTNRCIYIFSTALLLACLSSSIYLKAALAEHKSSPTAPTVPAATSSTASNAPTAATTTYVDKVNGFTIDFPRDWKTKSDPIVTLVATPGTLAKEINPFANVKIVARSLPSGESLDTICDTSMRQWASLWKVESDQRTLKGKTATRRLVLMQLIPQANLRTKVLKAFAANSDNYFIVSCADKPEHFEQSKKTFEAIVDSLKLNTK